MDIKNNSSITDVDFINFCIKYLLGDDWYIPDPLCHNQVNAIALNEILSKYSKRFKKERKNGQFW